MGTVVGNDVLSSSLMAPMIGQTIGDLMIVGGRHPFPCYATLSYFLQEVAPNPFSKGQIRPCE